MYELLGQGHSRLNDQENICLLFYSRSFLPNIIKSSQILPMEDLKWPQQGHSMNEWMKFLLQAAKTFLE